MEQETQAETGSSEVAAPETVRESLLKSMDQIEQKVETPEVAPDPKAEIVPRGTIDKTRDETGKFVAKTKEVLVEIKPPESWSAGDRKKYWDTLNPETKEALRLREEEVHKGFTKFDEERTLGKQMKDAIQPYMPIIQAEGGNPVAAVQDLLNTAYQLRTANPQQKGFLLGRIAQQFGADLNVLLQGGAQPQLDPQVAMLQQQLQQTQAWIQQRDQASQQQAIQNAQASIDAFAKEKPLFEKARPVMSQLLGTGVASDLADAYEKACRLDPELFSELQKASEAEKGKEAAAKAQAKRSAAVSLTGAPGTTTTPTKASKGQTVRQSIEAAFEEHGA